MRAHKLTRKQLKLSLGLFCQHYLWTFSYILFHRDLQRLFVREPFKRWEHVSRNAHFIMTMTAFRILNEFFRKSDRHKDIRSHHFGFQSRGQFMPQKEIDRVSTVFMHISYESIRLRRSHWNTKEWYERLAGRSIPFLKFVRDHHFPRSPKMRKEINNYITMTDKLLDYVCRIAKSENAIT